ncbi:MAG: hypothetical protein H7Y33_11960, partial [Cytophagales bacterium]|nr:hypothetical protein [Rhizobacter sp.]
LSSLLRRADEALYAAKASGRNAVVSRPAPQRDVEQPAPSPVSGSVSSSVGSSA